MKINVWSRKMQAWLVVAIGLLVLIGWTLPWGPHKRIDPATVSQVRFVSADEQQTLSPNEAAKVIGWFNEIKGERNNSGHAGPGCGSPDHLEIALTSGEEILIWGGNRVNRYPAGERTAAYTDYYFDHPQLAAYSQSLAAKGGC